MTYLESVLQRQAALAERIKLREAEETVCEVVLRVGRGRGVTLPVNGRELEITVTDEYERDVQLQFVGDEDELEGDERRDVLFALVREVGE